MMLLEAHNVMDGSVTIPDLIMIVGGLASIAKLWYGQVQNFKKAEGKIEALNIKINTLTDAYAEKLIAMEDSMKEQIEAQKEYFRDAKESRSEIRKDYKHADETNHEIMNARVNKLQAEVKEDRKDNKAEFEKINVSLNSVSTDTKAILMMLQNK